ncbi:MAG: hypothetical protein Q7V56_16685 [Gammaproteobacteria bacterium]|nr:hypothetical protein [Gammaproteobacteria bacterium]
MFRKIIPITAIAFLTLTGCQETPSETAEDVAEAREDAAQDITSTRQDANQTVNNAQRDVVDARQDLVRTDRNAVNEVTEAEAEVMIKTAHANYDVIKAEAEGRNEVAKERCGAFTGASKDSCVSEAEMTLASSMAAATSDRDAALLAAERH